MMRKLLVLLAFIGLLSANEQSAKVVINLTTANVKTFDKKVLQAIASNKNYYANSLRDLEVAVVIHGGAYRFFVKDLEHSQYKDDKELRKVYADLKKRIAAMADTYEVEFLMCKAGMKKHKLEAKDVFDFVKFVPNATIGLINKQNEGFAYIPVND
jgi:uncharacterized protein